MSTTSTATPVNTDKPYQPETTGVDIERRAKHIHRSIIDPSFDLVCPATADTFYKKMLHWVAMYPDMSGWETYQVKCRVLKLGIESGNHVARVPTDRDGNPYKGGPGLMYMPEEHLPFVSKHVIVEGDLKGIMERYGEKKINPAFYAPAVFPLQGIPKETITHFYGSTAPQPAQHNCGEDTI